MCVFFVHTCCSSGKRKRQSQIAPTLKQDRGYSIIYFEVSGSDQVELLTMGGKYPISQVSNARGPFLFETFGPQVNRANLALSPKRNSMSGIQQWRIKPWTRVLKGEVAPQFEFGSQYVGGGNQIWVPNPWENLLKP